MSAKLFFQRQRVEEDWGLVERLLAAGGLVEAQLYDGPRLYMIGIIKSIEDIGETMTLKVGLKRAKKGEVYWEAYWQDVEKYSMILKLDYGIIYRCNCSMEVQLVR